MVETDIKASLILLLDGINKADGAAIGREMEKLDGFVAQGGGCLHPQLAHFLERRSYAKALAFLGGESDIPAASCGRRKQA